MKIGILTLPLHTNHGGNLQAFALMYVLKGLGHEVTLVNRHWNRLTLRRFVVRCRRWLVQDLLLRRQHVELRKELGKESRSFEKLKVEGQYTQEFIEKYVTPRTEIARSSRELDDVISKYNFDAIIVGSDQVWRPEYTPNIEDYFLTGVGDNVLKIAYAASFGKESFGVSEEVESSCKRGLERFAAVSVREDTGVELCGKLSNVSAQVLCDPTLLIEKATYEEIFNLKERRVKEPYIATYILDHDKRTESAIDEIAKYLKLPIVDTNKNFNPDFKNSNEYVKPPTEEWLRYLFNAEFLVVDSFHGCIFSLIFEKRFVVFGNIERGMARFSSLLSKYDLLDRLVIDPRSLDFSILEKNIDWHQVKKIIDAERQLANKFLVSNLSGSRAKMVNARISAGLNRPS